jgi:polar amino acid transport system substrate-binding protein
MILQRPFSAVFCALLALCGPAAAAPADTIRWGVFPTPPFMITEGPQRFEGSFDQVRTLLMARMPAYSHQLVQAPFPRVFHEIAHGSHWCFVGATRSAEREDMAWFSLPAVINLPYKIIVRRAELARFGAHPQSLEKLLATPGLRTSVLRKRAINPVVDALLRAHPPAQEHSDFTESIRMLLAGRLDYLVETEAVVDYYASRAGREGELVALDIAEYNAPSYFYVMCPKNAWGRGVIDAVDAVLRAERPTPYYRALMEKWRNADAARRVRDVYDSGFLQAH